MHLCLQCDSVLEPIVRVHIAGTATDHDVVFDLAIRCCSAAVEVVLEVVGLTVAGFDIE